MCTVTTARSKAVCCSIGPTIWKVGLKDFVKWRIIFHFYVKQEFVQFCTILLNLYQYWNLPNIALLTKPKVSSANRYFSTWGQQTTEALGSEMSDSLRAVLVQEREAPGRRWLSVNHSYWLVVCIIKKTRIIAKWMVILSMIILSTIGLDQALLCFSPSCRPNPLIKNVALTPTSWVGE